MGHKGNRSPVQRQMNIVAIGRTLRYESGLAAGSNCHLSKVHFRQGVAGFAFDDGSDPFALSDQPSSLKKSSECNTSFASFVSTLISHTS